MAGFEKANQILAGVSLRKNLLKINHGITRLLYFLSESLYPTQFTDSHYLLVYSISYRNWHENDNEKYNKTKF